MNPNFALDFRSDQIVLLHSQEGVWVQIGVVAIDDPDLDAALGYLRSTALGLSPRGIASQLILPDAAILYTTLGDLSLDPQMRAAQIATALIGRTPYEVADLVYDWRDDGSKAHLAVIARETLDEAEAFANQHRFNAFAFAAWPEQGQFPGDVDFGRSAKAVDIPEPIEIAVPQGAPALSALDFEMGEAVQDIETDAAPPLGSDQIDTTVSAAFDAALVAQAFDAQKDWSLSQTEAQQDLELPDPALHADLSAQDVDSQTLDIQAVAADRDGMQEDDQAVDLARSSIEQPDPLFPELGQDDLSSPDPAPVVQPDLFAQPQEPSFSAIMDESEAPMALDVPIDDSIVEDPVATPSPSAGKAQTLLAEFAARREASLGKADSTGRIEPALTAGKPATPDADAAIIAESRVEPAAKIKPLAAQNTLRAPETSLGNKPSVKRPAPKPRGKSSVLVGFVLTILLLIALAAAAGMSSYLSAAWNSYGVSTQVAADDTPSVADEMAADLPSDEILPPNTPAPQTAELSVPSALSDPVTVPLPNLALSAENPVSLVPLATPAALPKPIVVAPPNISTASTPITPTAQGVMTPEGVILIAGRPSLVPSPRPDSIVTAALQRPAVAEINPVDSAPTISADPALVGKKPQSRPDGLVPQTISDPALAGKKPLLRPETVLAAANSANIAAASLAQPEVNTPRSAMAVTISRLPVARPRNLNTTIDAPQVLALATPDEVIPEAVAPEIAATNAPLEADNEPEVVAPKSSGPRTVVSQNATFRNAINLSKVNLIGVYGSQANRYALIRQSNGRFKKVYVGDRFDGGMVAAITESELRYSKGGQMLALQMPNG